VQVQLSTLQPRMRPRRSRFALYVALPLISSMILGASHLHQQQKRCTGLIVRLHNAEGNNFLGTSEIENLIEFNTRLYDAPVGEIELARIEHMLAETQYVDFVDAYLTSDDRIGIELSLRTPIARFIGEDGRNFYLDQQGLHFPTSRSFAARTVLVRGQFAKQFDALNGLLRCTYLQPGLDSLLTYLHRNPIWKAQIAEVVVDASGNITLYPEFGQMRIELGRPHSLPEKFAKLEQFYRLVLPRVGWDHYTDVHVGYNDQIVATRSASNNN
jgi:cell division protein FtsQ